MGLYFKAKIWGGNSNSDIPRPHSVTEVGLVTVCLKYCLQGHIKLIDRLLASHSPVNDILFLDVHTELVHPDTDSRNLLVFFPSKLWVSTTRNIRFSHYCSLKMDEDGSLLLWKNMIKARVLYRQVRILQCRGYSFLGDLKPYFWHVDKI